MSARPGYHIARTNKGHPRRQARRDRATERIALHEWGRGCGPNCPKRPDFKGIAAKFGRVSDEGVTG